MSEGPTAATVVLGVLLTTTLLLGSVVFAAHATVLDPDFTKETIDGAAVETDSSGDPLADRAPCSGQIDSADSGASQQEDR